MLRYLPSLLLFVGVWASLRFSQKRFRHPFSPFGIFYSVWFLALGLFFLGWVEYTPVHIQAWGLIALNLASFGLGWWAACLFQPAAAANSADFDRLQISDQRLFRVIVILFLLGALGIADFLWIVQRTLGLSTYIVSPYEIRGAMSAGGEIVERFTALTWLNICNCVLCTFYLQGSGGARKKTVWTILVLSLASTILMEDRTRFFFAVLWSGYVLLHLRPLNRRRIMRTLATAALLLVVQFFSIALWLGKIAQNNPELIAAATVEDMLAPLLTPYTYITGNFPALQAYVDSNPAPTSGKMTFYPAFKVVHYLNPTLKAPDIVAEPVSVPSEINTFTWLHQFYTDFGVVGVAIGPWVVAFVAGLIYFYMRQAQTFYSLYINGLICFALTLSFFVNHLTQGPLWYLAAVGFVIAKYLDAPARRLVLKESGA